VKLTFVYSPSIIGSCPTIYRTDRGTIAIQGYAVEDAEGVVNPLPGERIVEVPIELLTKGLALLEETQG
jgi:hypothetical protein